MDVNPVGLKVVGERLFHIEQNVVNFGFFSLELVKDGSRDGVSLKVDGHKVVFWFNRTGEIGGEVEYDGKVTPLTNKVQKQTGFEL